MGPGRAAHAPHLSRRLARARRAAAWPGLVRRIERRYAEPRLPGGQGSAGVRPERPPGPGAGASAV